MLPIWVIASYYCCLCMSVHQRDLLTNFYIPQTSWSADRNRRLQETKASSTAFLPKHSQQPTCPQHSHTSNIPEAALAADTSVQKPGV